jgi:AcrR family transcriptional regulator
MYQMVQFVSVAGKGPREKLLNAAMDYVAGHGMSDVSLRALAEALGTSHRMLIHHFGSKEGLWVEIVRAVEQRQRALLSEIDPQSTASAGEALWAWWKHISDPALWPNERLFFEIYGQALQGRRHATAVLDGIVEDWLEPATELNVAFGVPRGVARAHARLGIAVTRGLLLDLVATREVDRVDEAMRAFVEVYESWLWKVSSGPASS